MSPAITDDATGYLDLERADGERILFHGTAVRRLTDVPGLPGFGLVGARQQLRRRPAYHGSINRSRWMKERVITLEGFVVGDTPAQAQAELGQITAALYDALDSDRLLRWRLAAGAPELQTNVRLAGDDTPTTVVPPGKVIRYQAHLIADDPRGYSQTATVATSGPMGNTGGGFTFPLVWPLTFADGDAGVAGFDTSSGTLPTPATLSLNAGTADLVAPTVQLDTDRKIALSGTIGAGDSVTFDTGERTLRIGGGLVHQDLLDFAATRWFDLPRGVGVLRMLAASAAADAYMTVTYRPAYG